MTEKLDRAYKEIKNYAFEAMKAQRQEKRTQTLFSMFVPEHVIHEFFANPEDSLVGDNRILAVLFSDIRGFTTISEKMSPENLVHSLNRYFESMVAPIIERKGIVEDYIGDAIKAFFGAKADPSENYALQSVQAALDMMERLIAFNSEQLASQGPRFPNGLGINYGVVTIGNIGTEKKKKYSVIGETADLAEYLENLTKVYKEQLIISESLYRKVKDDLRCRLLDTISWGERKMKIFTARRTLTPQEEEGWATYDLAMAQYSDRSFVKASDYFRRVLKILPQDHAATLLLASSETYSKNPPPSDWDGVGVMLAR
jgi:class 3 adenylate cyclase